MAERVAGGVESITGVEAVLKKAVDAQIDHLLECDGLVIGSPEYFGYMSGMVKDFFDRTYEEARGKREIFRKPYAVFISAGNDGTNALNHIERICTGYQFKKIHDPVVAVGDVTPQVLATCEELGKTIALGCREGIY
jgi:multimeric flavodoxin WrbA